MISRVARPLLLAGVLCAAAQPSLAQTGQTLTLHEAEQIASENHPQIRSAEHAAQAAGAQMREAQSAYYPQVYGSLTGVDALANSRIAAGGLNNPVIYDRYANGVTVGQLVTDFGRTGELVKSVDLQGQAQQENVVTTRAAVVLRVDQAYFAALRAQAVLHVAEQTVQARQLVLDQVTAFARNQLKSDLDVSFAGVDVAQAQLLLVQAQNDVQAAFADVSAALGYADQRTFVLVDEPLPPGPPTDIAALTAEALRNRPELVSQRLAVIAADHFAAAEGDLWRPTVSFVATAGLTPYRQDTLTSRYAAAGVNMNIPIFNGHLFGALHAEAAARALAQQDALRNLEISLTREVRVAWLNANAAFQRLALTDQLLSRATQAVNLAQSRYQLGLSSIVELSQAQLNVTQAEIAKASARYDYATLLSALDYQAGRHR